MSWAARKYDMRGLTMTVTHWARKSAQARSRARHRSRLGDVAKTQPFAPPAAIAFAAQASPAVDGGVAAHSQQRAHLETKHSPQNARGQRGGRRSRRRRRRQNPAVYQKPPIQIGTRTCISTFDIKKKQTRLFVCSQDAARTEPQQQPQCCPSLAHSSLAPYAGRPLAPCRGGPETLATRLG